MTLRSIDGQADCDRESLAPPSIGHLDETSTSPRLEVADLDDTQKFSDLFDSLGLHIPQEQKNRISRSFEASYEIENYPNVKHIDPEWKHDEIEEIVVVSPKRANAFDLSTIHEEPSVLQVPSACLADFDIVKTDICSNVGPAFKVGVCTRKDNGQRYVIKRKQTRNDSSWSEKVVLEMLASLSTPFVETIRWSFRNEEYVYIVLDTYVAGTLLDLVNHHGPLGSHKATFYASELVCAILSLHNAGIMHKDLDPRSVSLDTDGHIVITHFSRAESFPQTTRPHGVSCNVGFGDTMSEFRAPEIFLGWELDSAVDCWSFGMLCYFMMFGTHPYGERDVADDPRWLYDRVVVFSVPTESLRLVHPMARDLITKCLQRNPSLRWSMEKIKSHGYFALVDWDQVAAKQVDAPSFRRTAMEVDRAVFQTQSDSHQRDAPSVNEVAFPPAFSRNLIHPATTPTGTSNARSRITISELANASEIFRPLSISTIAEALHEDDEPVSLSASTGHVESERDETSMSLSATVSLGVEQRQQPPPVHAQIRPTDKVSRFWAELDQEEQQSSVSIVTEQEFGGSSNNIPFTHGKVPKLRKYRSAIHAQRLFSLSTASFQKRLKQKPKSSGALRQGHGHGQGQGHEGQGQGGSKSRHAERIDDLPMGIQQSGSGIGFTYNIPSGVPSKVSVRSFAPSCNQFFHGGITNALSLNLNRGLGLGQAQRVGLKAKNGGAKQESSGGCSVMSLSNPQHGSLEAPASQGTPTVLSMPTPRAREVGNATFIRDMYRSPSWIFSPPDSLPSPMALVNPNPVNSCSNSPSMEDGRNRECRGVREGIHMGRNAHRDQENHSEASPDSSGPFTPATLVSVESNGVGNVKGNNGSVRGHGQRVAGAKRQHENEHDGEHDKGPQQHHERGVSHDDDDDDEDCPEEVNISIPKNLELDLDFRMWAPDSTLRLVPPSRSAAAAGGGYEDSVPVHRSTVGRNLLPASLLGGRRNTGINGLGSRISPSVSMSMSIMSMMSYDDVENENENKDNDSSCIGGDSFYTSDVTASSARI
ncbi:Serine/threonine-protein kinase AtPK2/AtPK19 [Psilocybe cubensis]|uniref:Serine/threonine-protein kinase AtPK2/AtPK19 n=1 Tax=Psilocybe cubensis TaxID=181762 RepID=A0ACB8GSS5_PSICU|nr:Serine/threonine-protein kinase AtPK2/AtPK19 [Psilocybe cubensis]KAH9478286.1 Serine/threonine-protein kinase AtPK2/AtPK19 [Psilocybe cubensis]